MPDNANRDGSTPTIVVDGPIATITLRRPIHHNRLEAADFAVLMAALDQLEANRNVRCLITTATGPTFSAGYDIGKLALGGDNDEMFGLCDRVENLVQPTICALNGNVYGAATDLALACDIRLGIEGMKMFMPPAKLGMHYYYSGLRRYVQQLGLGNAKRLILSGAMIEAPEMLQIGFLDELLAPDALHARVVVLAGMIADGAPTAVQGMKASMERDCRGHCRSAGGSGQIPFQPALGRPEGRTTGSRREAKAALHRGCGFIASASHRLQRVVSA